MARCDENTIGVVAILGSTFDGSYEPVAEICAALDAFESESGIDMPVHVDGASGGDVRAVRRSGSRVGLPAAARRFDQHVGPQVRARIPGGGLDRLARRRRAARRADLPRQLPRRHDADVRAQLLTPGRAGGRAVLQLPAAGLRGLPARAAVRAGHRDRSRRADRRARAVRAADPRRRVAGVRVRAEAGGARTTQSSTSRSRCASAAGRCPRTRSPRIGPTSRCCGSSCGAASRTTWPTCSSRTSSGSCQRLEQQPAPTHDATTATAFAH